MTNRSSLLWFETAIVALTAALAAYTLLNISSRHTGLLLFLSSLVLIASFLRVTYLDGWIGFEAAVAFPATVLFHEAGWVLIAVLAGSLAHRLYVAITRRRLTREALFDISHTALSYYFVALLFVGLTPHGAPLIAKASAYLVLVIGLLFAQLTFAMFIRHLRGVNPSAVFGQTVLFQAKSLLLISPIVAVEILMYQHYGSAGFVVGFLPVLLVAYVMQSESIAESQNIALIERNRELSLLSESSSTLLSAEGERQTFERLVAIVGTMLPLRAAAVVRWGSGPEIPSAIYRFGNCRPSERAILDWVEGTGFADSVPREACLLSAEERALPLSAVPSGQVIIGILTPEVIYGALIFESDEGELQSADRLKLLGVLARQTALTLQDQLLREETRISSAELEKKAQTLTAILRVSNEITGNHDVDAVLGRIAAAIRSTVGFENVLFVLYDSESDTFVRRAHAGLDDIWETLRTRRLPAAEVTNFFRPEFEVSNSYFVSHLNIRQSDQDLVLVAPAGGVEREGEWHPLDILMVPLMSGEDLIGYLSVREPIDKKIPSTETIQTLEIFANQAVAALESARQFEEIKQLTFVDGLTAAYNHRYFRETLEKEIHRHSRARNQFTLVMIDVDDFKRINDTLGHPVGDQVLKGLVDELISSVRDIDVVSRYGGEEFTVLFPDTDGDRGREVANRMRLLVSSREFKVTTLDRPLRITISLGLAVFPADGSEADVLIARADAALYHAKANGKNQVVMASSRAEAVARVRASEQ